MKQNLAMEAENNTNNVKTMTIDCVQTVVNVDSGNRGCRKPKLVHPDVQFYSWVCSVCTQLGLLRV